MWDILQASPNVSIVAINNGYFAGEPLCFDCGYNTVPYHTIPYHIILKYESDLSAEVWYIVF